MPRNAHIAGIVVASFVLAYVFMLWRYAAKPPFRVAGYYGLVGPHSLWDLSSPDKPWSWMKMKRSTLVKLRRANDLVMRETDLPISINSGHRTDQHNERIGGVSQSSHIDGYAIDADTNPPDEKLIQWALETAGFDRIGIYDGHIHADNDPQKPAAQWLG